MYVSASKQHSLPAPSDLIILAHGPPPEFPFISYLRCLILAWNVYACIHSAEKRCTCHWQSYHMELLQLLWPSRPCSSFLHEQLLLRTRI